mmetsp:Transcript_138625/g.276423  ORF Transcript_138625/g.276423 Transcript_138625/m.276423 type:complete len:356 (-) Transcript_138625:117-1184(-)
MDVSAITFCVSGTALGAVISSLLVQLLSRQQQRQRPQTAPRSVRAAYRSERKFEEDNDDDDDEPKQESRAREVPRKLTTMPTADDLENCLGFTMQEAKRHAEAKAGEAKERTPTEVLHGLQKGNTRFWMGMAKTQTGSAFHRRALISMQYPSVAVLGCSDSRVPVEIVFDQGLGDLFVVRVAGNCLETSTMASLQYAIAHLKVKVLVVMGHEGCGAVKAAGLPSNEIEKEPEALASALQALKRGLEKAPRLAEISDHRSRDREAVVTNVRAQIEGLSQNETVMSAVRNKELIVVGAFYEISSGIVDFFLEITEVPDNVHGDELALPVRSVSRSFFEVKSGQLNEVAGPRSFHIGD